MRIIPSFCFAALVAFSTRSAAFGPPIIESVEFFPGVSRSVGAVAVNAKGDFAWHEPAVFGDGSTFYYGNGWLGGLSGARLVSFIGSRITFVKSTGTGTYDVGSGQLGTVPGLFTRAGFVARDGSMLGERRADAGGQTAFQWFLRSADGREREVSNDVGGLAAPNLLLLCSFPSGAERVWSTQVLGSPALPIGPQTGHNIIVGANAELDFFGSFGSNAVGIIDDQTLEFAPDDGLTNARAISITSDKQIIGYQWDAEDSREGRGLWVAKDGMKHDLMPALLERIGPVEQWETLAASEGGWVIGRDAQDPTPHFWRVKIRVSDDRDEDGLLDEWEREGGGIDVDGDGSPEIDLWALGARPDHKDLFVEIDAGMIPMSDEAVSMVEQAFADAPLDNPDQTQGIRLHLLRDEVAIEWQPGEKTGTLGIVHSLAFTQVKARHFGTVGERNSPVKDKILAAKAKAFRYAVIYDGLQWPGSPLFLGNAERGGNDMAIDFGQERTRDGVNDVEDQATILMHELGHTLGLGHGGGTDDPLAVPDSFNGKPNYPSIMNYTMAFRQDWNRRFWRLDYCREQLATLDEGCLWESQGIASTLYRVTWLPYSVGPVHAPVRRLVPLNGQPVDFNGNGFLDEDGCVSADLNHFPDVSECTTPSPGDKLVGHDDWRAIRLKVFPDGKEAYLAITYPEGCGDPAVLAALDVQLQDPGCPQGDLDCSGSVDTADVALMLLDFGDCPACDADLDGDGAVTTSDLSLLLLLFTDMGGGGESSKSGL